MHCYIKNGGNVIIRIAQFFILFSCLKAAQNPKPVSMFPIATILTYAAALCPPQSAQRAAAHSCAELIECICSRSERHTTQALGSDIRKLRRLFTRPIESPQYDIYALKKICSSLTHTILTSPPITPEERALMTLVTQFCQLMQTHITIPSMTPLLTKAHKLYYADKQKWYTSWLPCIIALSGITTVAWLLASMWQANHQSTAYNSQKMSEPNHSLPINCREECPQERLTPLPKYQTFDMYKPELDTYEQKDEIDISTMVSTLDQSDTQEGQTDKASFLQALEQASEQNNLETFSAMFLKNQVPVDYLSLFYHNIIQGRNAIAEFLLTHKAIDPTTRLPGKETIIVTAIKHENIDIISKLIHTTPELLNLADDQGLTPYLLSIKHNQFELSTLLKELGANINAKTNDGRTVLHLAGEYDNERVVRLYLTNQQALKAHDNAGNTSLHLAARNNHQITLRLLAEASPATVNMRNNNGKTPLHIAAESGSLLAFSLLYAYYAQIYALDNNLETPEALASRNKHFHITAFIHFRLLDTDENDEAPSAIANDHQGLNDIWHEVHYAAKYGHLKKLTHLIAQDPSLLNQQTSQQKWTLLHIAALYNQHSIVSTLLRLKARVDLNAYPNKKSKHTALHAAITGNSGYALIKELLQAGVPVNPQDLDFACRKNSYHGCKALLTIAHICADTLDEEKGTPLFTAAAIGTPSLVELLAQHNATLEKADKQGHTPLFLSIATNNLPTAATLLRLGVNPDTLWGSNKTETVLISTLVKDLFEIAQLLHQYGANHNFSIEETTGFFIKKTKTTSLRDCLTVPDKATTDNYFDLHKKRIHSLFESWKH